MIDFGCIEQIARSFFTDGRGSHGWDHTLRVVRLAQRIARAEGADMDVVVTAAYLHDIGRSVEDESEGSLCHADYGGRLAETILHRNGFRFTAAQQDNVLHCIRSHRFRGKETPVTLEAKVVFDADKLDAIGAIGIARAYLFAGEIGARLHCPEIPLSETLPYTAADTGYREYAVRLRKIRDIMLTAEGRRMANDRHRFMEGFFDRFLQEYEGER
ncbi:MAG: HD domain-containing protein [Thermodesulfobacteriota bacterium]